ncbi:hypothetical protein [Chitinophaga qingshengii]|uniref:Lipoprotein n=1 Tax=Chitinophaga qingshengii TaxID=1569794 RepID=A0ABR7TXI9_9BACT|nr:hypothetical protein [Chitinophaga qingshengii]MBC9934136.1 hypothetical protein [Chitinophaga qingshengii]
MSLILLAAISLGPGCHKSKQSDPCDGVVSEGMPTQAALILMDGQTGENILSAKNIDATTISITTEPADLPLEKGMIVKEAASPLNGALMFHIADTKKGAFKYKVTIPNVGSTTLSYINKEEKTNNPCNPLYINVADPVIEDHQFTLTRTVSRLVFKVTM